MNEYIRKYKGEDTTYMFYHPCMECDEFQEAVEFTLDEVNENLSGLTGNEEEELDVSIDLTCECGGFNASTMINKDELLEAKIALEKEGRK